MRQDRPYRIVVPTRDSERWITAFYRAYRRLGIEPHYLVDTRSIDQTIPRLSELGATIHRVTPRHDRVEAMLSLVANMSYGGWIVRFDDDELPSAMLIDWLDNNLHGISEPAIAISRRDVMRREGRLFYSQMELYYFHPGDPLFLDPQWRCFLPGEVEFTDQIHTPGFVLDRYATAPADAYFVHFDWILRSQSERMEKLRRYERQNRGSGWKFAQYYLPELSHPDPSRWALLDNSEFDDVLSAIE